MMHTMIHQKLKDGNGFGVSVSSSNKKILLQLMDEGDGEQVRVSLTLDEVLILMEELLAAINDPKFILNYEKQDD